MILAIDANGKLIEQKRGRPQHKARKRGEMNATEQAFSNYLDLLLKCHVIKRRSAFEEFQVRMPPRSYTPDFVVTRLDGTKTLYDVKGCRLTKAKRIPRPWIEPQDKIRLEMFARAFPEYKFVVAFRHKQQWYEQEVLG